MRRHGHAPEKSGKCFHNRYPYDDYVNVPVEAAVASMVEMGMSQFMAETFGELFVNFAANGADRVTDDVARVTGHPARSIDDFARDFAAVFGG